MARYRLIPQTVEATQWFKNGDHPLDYAKPQVSLENDELREFSPDECKANKWEGQVVRYYRRPDVAGRVNCGHCQQPMHLHGWIDQGSDGLTVCPGEFVLTDEDGQHFTSTAEDFFSMFEPLED